MDVENNSNFRGRSDTFDKNKFSFNVKLMGKDGLFSKVSSNDNSIADRSFTTGKWLDLFFCNMYSGTQKRQYTQIV